MAGIHKKQEAPKARPLASPRPAAAAPAAKPDDDHDHEGSFGPLKLFALLTALGLFLTTSIGLAVALGTRSMQRTSAIMLAAGVVVPLLLLAV
jgi:hypothetical protein